MGLIDRLNSYKTVSAIGSILTPFVTDQRPPKPYMMTFIVTRRCNSRCQMCYIWQEKDSPMLSLEEIKRIFLDDDFSFVRMLTLSGGEPTLRMDLPDLYDILLAACPKLGHTVLCTSGLNVNLTLRHVRAMLERAADHPYMQRFLTQVSLDGVGEMHDEIRGIDGFFDRVQRTLAGLQEMQAEWPMLGIKLSTVVMPRNLSHMRRLHALAQKMKIPIHFSPVVIDAGYFGNTHVDKGALWFQPGQYPQAVEFFEELGRTDTSSLKFYYRDIAKMLQGAKRGRKCMMGLFAFVVEHDGQVYPCVNCETASFGNLLEQSFEEIWYGPQAMAARARLRAECCPSCVSLCYTPAVNIVELAEVVWHRKLRPTLLGTNVNNQRNSVKKEAPPFLERSIERTAIHSNPDLLENPDTRQSHG